MFKVKKAGKIDLVGTVKANAPRVRKSQKEKDNIKRIIDRRKRAERDARLVKFF